jgi:pimeloyl-ACP methyl ester carboxylesterase
LKCKIQLSFKPEDPLKEGPFGTGVYNIHMLKKVEKFTAAVRRGRWHTPHESRKVRLLADATDQLFGLFYLEGRATTASPTKGGDGKSLEAQRTLANRIRRANLLHEMSTTKREHRQEILRKAAVLDEFDRQFMNQEKWSVDTPWGKLSAYGADIDLTNHPSWNGPKSSDYPPIFLIPALSGDLHGVEPLLRELALQGRRVICIAYPEAHHGHITPEFVEEVKEQETFAPHVRFFEEVMKAKLGEECDREIWGYSAGGAIAGEILTRFKWLGKISRGVLLAPASLVEQSLLQFGKGFLHDVKDYLDSPEQLQDTGIVLAGKNDLEKKQHEKGAKRGDVFKRMLQLVCSPSKAYQSMQVIPGGEIIVVAAKEDQVTQGSKAPEVFAQNTAQPVTMYQIPGGHLAPLLQAKEIVNQILNG